MFVYLMNNVMHKEKKKVKCVDLKKDYWNDWLTFSMN